MGKDRESDAFLNCMEVQYVQPGMLLSSAADLFKSEWRVESTCCIVATREVELTMVCGGRRLVKATAPDELVLRKVHKRLVHV